MKTFFLILLGLSLSPAWSMTYTFEASSIERDNSLGLLIVENPLIISSEPIQGNSKFKIFSSYGEVMDAVDEITGNAACQGFGAHAIDLSKTVSLNSSYIHKDIIRLRRGRWQSARVMVKPAYFTTLACRLD